MIFAFVGVRQLDQFGAGIYVADLVAVAMVREMAPIMTAIIMAGRTGAAYAAGLGTMKVKRGDRRPFQHGRRSDRFSRAPAAGGRWSSCCPCCPFTAACSASWEGRP